MNNAQLIARVTPAFCEMKAAGLFQHGWVPEFVVEAALVAMRFLPASADAATLRGDTFVATDMGTLLQRLRGNVLATAQLERQCCTWKGARHHFWRDTSQKIQGKMGQRELVVQGLWERGSGASANGGGQHTQEAFDILTRLGTRTAQCAPSSPSASANSCMATPKTAVAQRQPGTSNAQAAETQTEDVDDDLNAALHVRVFQLEQQLDRAEGWVAAL